MKNKDSNPKKASTKTGGYGMMLFGFFCGLTALFLSPFPFGSLPICLSIGSATLFIAGAILHSVDTILTTQIIEDTFVVGEKEHQEVEEKKEN